MSKSILQIIYSCSVQKKQFKKKPKYSRNETTLKIGHHPKAIAQEKIPNLSQRLKFQKTSQNLFYKSFTVVPCKKRPKKH